MPLLQKGVEMAAGRMPKVIKPQLHAVLDYVVAGSFFIAGAVLWKRNKRAAISAMVCGGAATLNSMLTDYPGGVADVISFHTHGKIDAGLAGLTATMPRVMGFSDDPEAKFFTMQSLTETAVTAMTDFDYYERSGSSRLQKHQEEGAA